jgi:hypothetical protein
MPTRRGTDETSHWPGEPSHLWQKPSPLYPKRWHTMCKIIFHREFLYNLSKNLLIKELLLTESLHALLTLSGMGSESKKNAHL